MHAIGQSADYIAIGILLAFGLYTLLAAGERDERQLARLQAPARCYSVAASALTNPRSA